MPHSTQAYAPIAITGVHGRFPGAQDVNQFWQNLIQGQDCITQISGKRWVWQSDQEENDPVFHAGLMPHPDKFDQRFFGVLPKEAETMDPMQRIFLQTAWNALEDGGYDPAQLAGQKVGVFVGVGHADYPVLMQQAGVPIEAYHGTGIALTAIANKVSFFFDFHGPSESIDTACSSSLVAMHKAAAALHNQECDLAIVGGINLLLGPELFTAFSKAGMLSPEGRCHTFDAKADGYVRGEGAAAVILRPLEQAEAAQDFIYAVLKGSAENHGGRAHSFTAPNVNAQADVIKTAWHKADLSPADADLFESHGTGTPLGDPIEINAIKKAVDQPKGKIAIGALKSHIGHLEAAAGIAAIVKTLLSFQHGQIPANLNFQQLNPHIDLDDTLLYLPQENVELSKNAEKPNRAGISSFGFGGVNAHIVLESYTPHLAEKDSSTPWVLIPLSAQDRDSLNARATQLIRTLEQDQKLQRRARQTQLEQEICSALGISTQDKGNFLHQLNLAPQQMQKMLSIINPHFDLSAELEQLIGCQSVEEIAERLIQLGQGNTAENNNDQHLLCDATLSTEQSSQLSLLTISATLIEGRKQLPQRLAIVCNNKEDLLHQLYAFLNTSLNQDKQNASFLFEGRAQNSSPSKPEKTNIEANNLDVLKHCSENWVKHKKTCLSWDSVYPGLAKPARLPLPAYPFKLNRVWFQAAKQSPVSCPAELNVWQQFTRTTSEWPNSLAAFSYLMMQLPRTFNTIHKLQFSAPKQLPPDTKFELFKQSRRDLTTLQVAAQGENLALIQCEASKENVTDTPNIEWTNLTPTTSTTLYQQFEKYGVEFKSQYQTAQAFQLQPECLLIHFSAENVAASNQRLAMVWAHILAATRLLSSNKSCLAFKVDRISWFQRDLKEAMQLRVDFKPSSGHFSISLINKNAPLLVLQNLETRSLTPEPSAATLEEA